MLYFYMSPESHDDLKEKAKTALKKVIEACNNLQSLEQLLECAPDKILKHILQQLIKILKNNKTEQADFVKLEGLHKLQKLKSRLPEPLREKIDEINHYYPEVLVKTFSPEYASQLLAKMEDYHPTDL